MKMYRVVPIMKRGNLTVRVLNLWVSGQCVYTLPVAKWRHISKNENV